MLDDDEKIENAIKKVVNSSFFDSKVVEYTHKTCEEVFRKQEEIIKKSVHNSLLSIGINAKDTERWQKNIAHLDKLRTGSEEFTKWSKKAIWMALISAALFALWEGIVVGVLDSINHLKGRP